MFTVHQPDRGRSRGQSLVEFAIALPIFLLVVFGVFDAGRLVYANSVLSQAAREGARLAATEAAWVGLTGGACVGDESQITSGKPGAHVCPANVSTMKANVVEAVNRMTAGVGSVSAVYVSCNLGDLTDPAPTGAWTDVSGGNGCDDAGGSPLGASGELVSVRILHTFQPVTPIISSIPGLESVDLAGSATMVIH
jgi:hypothetical protein